MDTRRSTPKSQRTRDAIASAAKELFADKGFEATTVRDVAARANIDPSMVIRYFGSKDALFAQVAVPDLNLPDLTQIEAASVGQTLVRHFLDQWESEQGANRGGLAVLLRSAASNEDAADRLRTVFRDQVLTALARIGEAETAPRRAALVTSQLLGLALTRYVLQLPPMMVLSRETIIEEVGLTIQRYATGAATAPDQPPG
jgi:AcrR family transcriptional regulator